MGLFDKISATATGGATMNPVEAVAAIAVLSVASDGYLADDEIQVLWSTLSRMQLFKSYSSDVVRRVFDKICGILRRQGRDNLLHSAKASLPYELNPTVFAICTDLVMSDGTVEPEEEAFLEHLHQVLGVPQETALQIIQVMAIKNKG